MVINRYALTELREARGLTKRELAALAGISPSYLTELEKGDKPGSSKVIQRLADVLKINQLAIIGGSPKAS